MEPKLVDRAHPSFNRQTELNPDTVALRQARSDLEILERSYRKSSRTLQSMVLGMVFAALVFMAYGLFGTRIDREKYTTEVTPVHIELNTVSGPRHTATNPRNLQM